MKLLHERFRRKKSMLATTLGIQLLWTYTCSLAVFTYTFQKRLQETADSLLTCAWVSFWFSSAFPLSYWAANRCTSFFNWPTRRYKLCLSSPNFWTEHNKACFHLFCLFYIYTNHFSAIMIWYSITGWISECLKTNRVFRHTYDVFTFTYISMLQD